MTITKTNKSYTTAKKTYKVVKKLGKGGCSQVHLGQDEETNTYVAIKVSNRDYDSIRAINEEARILSKLKHKGIVTSLGEGSKGRNRFKDKEDEVLDKTFIVMEFVSSKKDKAHDLFDMIDSAKGTLGEDDGRQFLEQMLDALEYMHGQGVVHRDMKPENILIDSQGNYKIADFGLATDKNIDELVDILGTERRVAPEILERKQHKGSEIDIFALGTILFNVVTNFQDPFEKADKEDKNYKMVMDGQNDEFFAQFITRIELSQEFKDLVISMFAYDPSKRPTINQIRNSKWMKPQGSQGEVFEIATQETSEVDGSQEKTLEKAEVEVEIEAEIEAPNVKRDDSSDFKALAEKSD